MCSSHAIYIGAAENRSRGPNYSSVCHVMLQVKKRCVALMVEFPSAELVLDTVGNCVAYLKVISFLNYLFFLFFFMTTSDSFF